MTKPKFLYIDDEKDASVEAVRDGFNDAGMIEVAIEQPQDFKSQKKYLLDKLKQYDGLILDLRLDQNMQLDVAYNAPAIAQELRTAVLNKGNDLNPFPIILCSTDERMRATYDVDKTSHDLFDYKFLKGSEPNWKKFSTKLRSLATGYHWLSGNDIAVDGIFYRKDLSAIDPRITERFVDREEVISIHDKAHFVIKEMFHHPGPLVKERLLAARLGIHVDTCEKAWIELRDKILAPIKYQGLFSDGWSRWWADGIPSLFKDISKGKRLSTLNAPQRVQVLKENTGINELLAAEPIPHCKSTEYWTVCEGHKRPLDPLEGFRVFESTDLKPWQESKYISFNASEVERIGRDKGLRPHPTEKDRIQMIKDSLTK